MMQGYRLEFLHPPPVTKSATFTLVANPQHREVLATELDTLFTVLPHSQEGWEAEADLGFEGAEQVFEAPTLQDVDCTKGFVKLSSKVIGLLRSTWRMLIFRSQYGKGTGVISGLPSMVEHLSFVSSHSHPQLPRRLVGVCSLRVAV